MPQVSKEIQPLIDLAKKGGYKVVPSGRSKHLRVLDKKGAVVTDENGPLIVSSTPSEHRDRDLTTNRWIKAGIIPYDPWKPPKEKQQNGEGKGANLQTEKAREARRLAEEEARKEREEETRQVRIRLDPIVTRLGGWEKKGMQSELGLILFHYLATANKVERYGTLSSAQQHIHVVKGGGTMSAKAVIGWTYLLDYLEDQGPDKIQERYMNLLREAKGLKVAEERAVAEAGDIAREREMIEEAKRRAERIATAPVRRLHPVQQAQADQGLSLTVELSFEDYGDLCQAIGNFESYEERYGEAGKKAVAFMRRLREKFEKGRGTSLQPEGEAENQ